MCYEKDIWEGNYGDYLQRLQQKRAGGLKQMRQKMSSASFQLRDEK